MTKKRKKHWSKIIEEAGVAVRIYERANSSALWYSVVAGGEKRRRSLKTTDRGLAETRARAIARSLAELQLTGADLRRVTLGQVLGEYFRKKAPSLSKRWRTAAETRRALFLAAWGREKAVADIGQHDVDDFAAKRMSGGLNPEALRLQETLSEAEATGVGEEDLTEIQARLEEALGQSVRPGTVEADLRWLSTAFRWARGVKIDGRRLLEANPLEGLSRPEEKNVRRPIASHDRYVATIGKADQVDPEGRLRCMLALARYTGRRENAICQLQADDVLRDPKAVRRVLASLGLDESAAEHYPHGGIRWRGETDKQGFDSVTPLSEPARGELDRYLERSPRLGATPLFPAPGDSSRPMRKDTAGVWLLRAEKLAGLPKLAGGRWHPYRRLFATELRALPVHDVAAAGGWRSVETVQRIYQRAEASGVLSAVLRVGNGGGA